MATPTPTPTPSSTPTPTGDQSFDATCTTAVPGQYGYVHWDACNSLYNYNPSFAAAVAVAVVFGLLSAAHIIQGIIFRKYYTWVVIMGALWEFISFATGAMGAHDQQNAGLATAHFILFFLAPLWINAFVYMTLARMVHFFVPTRSVGPFHGAAMSKYFVWADVVTFLVQAAGGSMASPDADPSTVDIGLKVYMVGIGVQQGCILAFTCLMVVFHRKMIALDAEGGAGYVGDRRTERVGGENPGPRRRGWHTLLYALYGVLIAISVRIIYRICEFASGIIPSNPVPFHEAYSYALDATPMILALLIIAVWHPGHTLVGPDSEFRRKTRPEKKAAKKARKEENERRKEEKKMEKEKRRMAKATKKDCGGGHVEVNLPQTAPDYSAD